MSNESTYMQTDDKYIVFKRTELIEALRGGAFGPLPEIHDAVVIRRQDLFAAPALATYAACIAIARLTATDEVVRKSLLDVADYFQRQSELAAAEGWKLPDV